MGGLAYWGLRLFYSGFITTAFPAEKNHDYNIMLSSKPTPVFPKYETLLYSNVWFERRWKIQEKHLWSTRQFHMKMSASDELWVIECSGDSRLSAGSHSRPVQPTQGTQGQANRNVGVRSTEVINSNVGKVHWKLSSSQERWSLLHMRGTCYTTSARSASECNGGLGNKMLEGMKETAKRASSKSRSVISIKKTRHQAKLIDNGTVFTDTSHDLCTA
jgi:hypothetical protein